ncbi:MAG: hypothetical protein FD123_2144 [Bacteroidetes bacterium]|nr:MAG: hypothetical protein FD123_2144 [Bacteroidota bacterium]
MKPTSISYKSRLTGLSIFIGVIMSPGLRAQCSVSAGADHVNCQQPVQVQATALTPGNNYVYSWSPANLLVNPNSASAWGPFGGPGVQNQAFVVTMTDTVGGCVTTDTVIVSSYMPVIDTAFICSPSTSTVLDFGPGASSYLWQYYYDTLGNQTALNVTTQTLTVTQPGYYFGYANFPGCGAITSNIPVVIGCNSSNSCSVSAGPDTVFCQSQNPQLNAVPGTPGNNYIFQWWPSTGLSNPNIANPTVYGVYNQVYTVTMTDTVTNCTVTDTITVSEFHFSVGDTSYSCNNSNVILDFGPGATNYFWQFYTDTAGNTTNLNYTTQTITVNQPGSYTGYATFPGCGALTSVFYVADSCVVTFCSVSAGPDTVFCQQQGQLNATPGTPGNYTYSWSPAYGLDNPNSQNPNIISGVSNQQYVVTMTDGNCTATDTVMVSAYYWHIDTIYNCDSSFVTLDFGPGAANYYWQYYTDTAGNTFPINANTQTLAVNQPGSYLGFAFYPGCGALTSIFYVIDSCNVPVGHVWPGDCNYDLTANMADVLHIGVGYNTTGATRPNASNAWYLQPMADWTQNFTNCNYKHADADGNGIINVNDTVPISLNYGLTHPYHFVPEVPVAASTPTLQLVASYDTCGLQTLVNVDIRLGTSSIPVDSLYGIAFRINMDANLIDTMMTTMNFTGSWLGTIGNNMIGFRKPFRSAGIIDACEVRNDQQSFNGGSGSIGSFQIVTTDNLSGIAILHLDVSNVTAITLSEANIPVAIIADSVVIDPTLQTSVPEYETAAGFTLYPNPASGEVFVSTTGASEQIDVLDMVGRTVSSVKTSNRNTRLDLAHLSAGVYLVRVKQGNSIQTQKLTITR